MGGNRIETWGSTPPSSGRSSGTSDGDAVADLGDVAHGGPVRQDQARDAEHPGGHEEPGVAGEVAPADEEAGDGEHQEERGRLAEKGDVEAGHREEDGGDGDGATDDELAREDRDAEPARCRVGADDRQQGHDEQQPLDGRAELPADLADLAKAAGEVAVDPVRGPEP